MAARCLRIRFDKLYSACHKQLSTSGTLGYRLSAVVAQDSSDSAPKSCSIQIPKQGGVQNVEPSQDPLDSAPKFCSVNIPGSTGQIYSSSSSREAMGVKVSISEDGSYQTSTPSLSATTQNNVPDPFTVGSGQHEGMIPTSSRMGDGQRWVSESRISMQDRTVISWSKK